MTIADLKPGSRGRITALDARGAVLSRLLAMGMLPTHTVSIERVAPTGDPMWIRLLGTQVALRRREASLVTVTAEQA